MYFEFPGKTDRLGVPAEVAQSVEQWSEESRRPWFAKLLRNSRLIPKFTRQEQWCRSLIVLSAAGRTRSLQAADGGGEALTPCCGNHLLGQRIRAKLLSRLLPG